MTHPGHRNGQVRRILPPQRLADLILDFRRHTPQLLGEETRAAATDFLERPDVLQLIAAQGTCATDDEATSVLNDLVGLCVRGRLQPLLAAYDLASPPYNYLEDFEENAVKPWSPSIEHERAPVAAGWRLLGSDVGFPLGIPASVLTTNARWVAHYAQRGFNILTYKTVRSQPYEAHPSPNWVFLPELDHPLRADEVDESIVGDLLAWPRDPTSFSMANSFGVPSPPPEEWKQDVSRCLRLLQRDQLLIVSVMGFAEIYSGDDLVEDFAQVALMAEDAGAYAIELNLSCPNSIDVTTGRVKDDLICESSDATEAVVSRVRERIGAETKLVIKLSAMPIEKLKAVVAPLAEARLINGVSGINTIQMRVTDTAGQPLFGPRDGVKRDVAGVSGVAIRDLGARFTQDLAAIRADGGLDFDIIAMGGVMSPLDVESYFRAGADAVQTATAAFFDPDLGRRASAFPARAPLSAKELEARARLLEVLDGSAKTVDELAKDLGETVLQPSDVLRERTRSILAALQAEGIVRAQQEHGQVVFSVVDVIGAPAR
jgi:dihydroorotate dehydrogenase